MKHLFFILALFVSIQAMAQLSESEKVAGQSAINEKTTGEAQFYFTQNGTIPPIRVFYYSPKSSNPEDLPIVFLLHGAHRDAEAYLDAMKYAADAFGCRVIAPEFDQQDYHGMYKYNLGNVYDNKTHKFNDSSEWSFSVIEPLFDTVVAMTKSKSNGYYMYGHSGGAQFVHRFMMYVSNNRIIKAAIANAGFYTALDNSQFPFGLQDANLSDAQIKGYLSKKVNILLGTADTDRNSPDLNKTQEADAQGKNRFQRGQFYYKTAEQKAKQLGVPLNWTLIYIPNVGHDNGRMSRFALALLFMDPQEK